MSQAAYQVVQLELPLLIALIPDIPATESVVWEIDEIIKLHGFMMESSLDILQKKGSKKEKLDVLQWVFTDFVDAEVYDEKLGKFVKHSVSTEEIPFSFNMCCKLSGYDREILREKLANKLHITYQ
jgi:hypothetical protein